MKVAVVGSRAFADYARLEAALNSILDKDDTLISGGAYGADQLAEKYAAAKGYKIEVLKPDWSIGRHAGLLRNTEIVNRADTVVAFWDGSSTGTADSIKKAQKQNKSVLVFRF